MPPLRPVVAALLVCLTLAARATAQDEPLAWKASEWFPERVVTFTEEPDIRVHVNEPVGDDARPTRVLVFALPNGNTLEQTLGCAPSDDRHWRYEIQHVAAQTRMLRSMLPDERIVLVAVEAKGLSWPNWRRTHEGANEVIAGKLAAWRERFGGADAKVTLAAHSGGGSFLWGVIEGNESLPGWLDRIAFLDANYSYDEDTHGAKLRAWLGALAEERHLIVIAYDDREIMFEGKKVVGPTGGTYRATERMHASFSSWRLLSADNGTLKITASPGFLFRSEVYANPENKILHTRLVGEMNGLVHAQLIGEEPDGWPGLTPPALYGEWIQPAPY